MFDYHTLVQTHQAEIREKVAQSRMIKPIRFPRLPRITIQVKLHRPEPAIVRTTAC